MHGEKREKRIGFDDDDMDYTSQTISILAELFCLVESEFSLRLGKLVYFEGICFVR